MTPTPSPAMGQEQTLAEVLAEAKRFARDNVKTLAEEIIEWQDTAMLRDGLLRELARMVIPLDQHHSLKLAESFVSRAALDAAIAQAAPAQTYIPVSVQPLPESGLIDLMVEGRRFTDCYFDRICDEWRKVDHCGHLIRLKRARITHWLAAPLASKEST